MDITKLYPEKVFYYFNEISKIPRGLKKEEKINNWLVEFAKNRELSRGRKIMYLNRFNPVFMH